MNKRSFLYQELSPEQLTLLCRHYLGEELLNAQLLKGGLFNTTYRLDTPSQRAVLRVGPVNRHLLLPYEYQLMQAEADVMQLMQRQGIPTSTLLAVDTSRVLLNRDLMLVKCLPASAMSTSEWPEQVVKRIQRESGHLMRQMHSITAAQLPHVPDKPYGRYASVLDGRGCATWREAILQEAAEWRTMAEAAKLVPQEVMLRIDACFARYAPLLDAVTEPRLVHCDLWAGNVLVTEDGQLAAIIDCDRAMFGDPEFDLSTNWMVTESFLQGYGGNQSLSGETRQRRQLYRLLLAMEDCYVFLAEYDNHEAYQEKRESILQLLEALESSSISQ